MLTIVIRLIVITAVVYAGVQFWYGSVERRLQKQIPTSRTVQPPPSAETAQEVVADTSSDDIAAILARNIFQVNKTNGAETSPNSAPADIDQLVQTQLSLSLLGTVTGDHDDDTRAIIRDDKTKLEDLYRVGSEIQGALVKHITRGRVVLAVNGRDEVLVIKDREGASGNAVSSTRPRRPISIGDPDEGMTKPTPRAVPRRRISFRSPAPKPPVVAPEEINGAPESEAVPVEAMEEPASASEQDSAAPESGQIPEGLEQEPGSAVDVPQQ